ncbi:hypothetical protein ASF25_12920 [Methylobacterium sp. Leaf100]|nr:hypothetical protein ASF25_12920 [Methylobacterium sp. Leaf100]
MVTSGEVLSFDGACPEQMGMQLLTRNFMEFHVVETEGLPQSVWSLSVTGYDANARLRFQDPS